MTKDIVGAGDRWIPDAEYAAIRARVPIVCVDLLPVTRSPVRKVGLIRRDTYDGGQGWCLVGGAIILDESIGEALARHLRTTLGPRFHFFQETLSLGSVAEYFRDRRPQALHDPRKHAVALSHVAECAGVPQPTGEALDFRWFRVDALPSAREFGFGQDRVVSKLLSSWR
ncbi:MULTISPECIES: DUF4916 domain-containing protein [Streptomyces]|uniref:DUF4916 domain-containing protein n=1 Tax=Streptomyces TaxID=1883 RepID=UPI000B0F7119|nr:MULTISPECIES: DUF4916 domain-containing protein [Streptomyces]MCH0556884.1 DUF4916 domain-containing protein [Streptomyces sp. MUM 16J]